MKRWSLGLALGSLLVAALFALPSPAPAAEDIVVGLPTSLGFWFGKGAEEAVNLAVEEINKAGGVNVGGSKRPFKLVTIDTRDSVPGVPTADSIMAVEKLILEKKPVALLAAPNRSEVMLAAMDLNAKYKVPQLVTMAKSPGFQKKVAENYDKYKYVFRLCEDVVTLGKYHTDYMKHLSEKFGFNKYFLIAQDTETGKAIHGLMTNLLKGAGWEQVGYEAIPLGTTDFSITVQKVKNSGAQVMLMFYDPSEIAILVDQWATMKVPAICLGLAGPMLDRTLWKSYGGKVESVALHVCEAGVFPVPSIPRSVEFFNNYSKRFGHAPEGVGGQAPSYDSVYVLKAAIEKAGSLDPDAIVEAIRNVDMPGAIGRIRFDKTNQVVFGNDGKETAVGLFVQWQAGGKLAAVFPLANAETATQLPPWMKK